MKRSVPPVPADARAIARGELIGRQATIVASNNAEQQGWTGLVVDETLKTLTLRIGERDMQLAKAGVSWQFDDGPAIDGRAIVFRPEDRTKKVKVEKGAHAQRKGKRRN